jgi:hypothetical protein
MLAATVGVLVAVPILGYVGVDAVRNSTGGKDPLADNLTTIDFPSTPTAALVTTDDAGVLTSVTVFALDPSGLGGDAVAVPITADIGFSDENRLSLQGAYAEGGADAIQAAIESLLVMTINVSEVADAERITSLLKPIEPIAVAGQGDISASEAAEILTTAAADGVESARRPQIDALWIGIAAAVGDGVPNVLTGTGVLPADFSEYAARLFAGKVEARGLSAIPLDVPDSDYEIEELSRSESILVFGSVAPGAVSAPSPGLVFRIEAPPGYDAEVQRTIDKLLFLGGNVVSVYLMAEPQPNTVFIVADEINRTEAETTNLIFGDFTFQEPTLRIDGVDLTVILGTEYLESVELVDA